VRVYNDRGSCLLRARVDGVVRSGVVCAPSVRWAKRAPDRRKRERAHLRAADRWAAAPRSIVAWYKWRESEIDDLAFTIPDVAIAHAKSLTLSASIEGTQLPPETYNKSGQYEYKRDVPASAFSKDAVRIQFSLDNAIPPAGAERRELGIIVASVGLEPK
jgi:hypothetical protein